MVKLLTSSIFILFMMLSSYAQDGTIDNSFNVGAGSDNPIRATAKQNDGKIIIGGYFTNYNNMPANHLARLNTDGTLDMSFNANVYGYVYCIAIQNDGKIIIGGDINYPSPGINIARLNTDGSLDLSFNVGTATNGAVHSVAIQNDGKIIIGGLFSNYNGIPASCIMRLNPNGSADTSFNMGAGAGGFYLHVLSIALQNDGKIIIGGSFSTYNNINRNGIARLNSDGTLDTSFNPGTGINGSVWCLDIQADGKIIIAGGFSTFNGVSRKCIARLNLDGSLDTSFNPGTGADGYSIVVFDIAIQCDGKIIIGGQFTIFNGTTKNHIARLNSNGSLDTNFNAETEAYGDGVTTIIILNDGKIVIGGYFTQCNGVAKNHIVALSGNGYFPSQIELIESNTCLSDNTQFLFSTNFGYDSLLWNFNDPISNTLNYSTILNPSHQFSATGSYNVNVIIYNSCIIADTISKLITIATKPLIDLGNDTSLCTGDSLNLGIPSGYTQYLWSTNGIANFIKAKTPGKYWGQATNNGCSNSDTININFNDYPILNLGNDTILCTSSEFNLNPDNNRSLSYLWSDNSSQYFLNVNQSGTYWVRASNNNCINSDTINILFDNPQNPIVTVSKDTVGYLEKVEFNITGPNYISYKWDFDDGMSSHIQAPNHTFMESGQYNIVVEAMNTNNCIVSRNLTVVVTEILFIPNLFTPNSDNSNDLFEIIYNGKEKYHLKILNKWGDQIFSSTEKSYLWDGSNASDDVYYYSLSLGSKSYSGWVQLIK